MNIIDKSDDELEAIAFPMWDDLIKYSNKGQYGKFIRNFSYDLLFGLNEVEVGKQFVKSELTRSLSPELRFPRLHPPRRTRHLPVPGAQHQEGRRVARAHGARLRARTNEVKIFGASIFSGYCSDRNDAMSLEHERVRRSKNGAKYWSS